MPSDPTPDPTLDATGDPNAAPPPAPAPRFELGLYSFVERTPDPQGRTLPAEARMRDLLEEIELADQVGLDVFGVGEHHRPEYLASAPTVILAAAAARTRRIRLTSAVTVLSSADPVRVFQEFATLDLISGGRAEIMAGRGSFVESFPLFGYDLHDYDELFAEHLELLLELRASERVRWSGRHRAPIDDRGVYPRPVQDPLPVWIAVGGTPASAARAGALGLPLALAVLGGDPVRFAPFAELHRESARRAGVAEAPPVSLNLHGFVAEDARRAADIAYPGHAWVMDRIGRERGWPPFSRAAFDAERGPRGALMVGSPEEVAERLLRHHEALRHRRVLLQLTVGSLPHRDVLRAIELIGTEVAPVVRAEVARREASGGAGG